MRQGICSGGSPKVGFGGIAKKIIEGKRLTSIDVIILLLDQMNKRIDEIKEDLRLLHQEVSSIKSDMIALMREKLKTG
jgi:hypothetical protein